VPTVAGGGVNFVRDIVDMVPHASPGNGHTATKQDRIPNIWAMGKLEVESMLRLASANWSYGKKYWSPGFNVKLPKIWSVCFKNVEVRVVWSVASQLLKSGLFEVLLHNYWSPGCLLACFKNIEVRGGLLHLLKSGVACFQTKFDLLGVEMKGVVCMLLLIALSQCGVFQLHSSPDMWSFTKFEVFASKTLKSGVDCFNLLEVFASKILKSGLLASTILDCSKLIALPFVLRVVCTLCFKHCCRKNMVALTFHPGNVHFFFAQRASTQPYASMLACVAVPTVAGGGVNFVRDIVDMVPHASPGNGHTATKQDQIPTIWEVGKLEGAYWPFEWSWKLAELHILPVKYAPLRQAFVGPSYWCAWFFFLLSSCTNSGKLEAGAV
jgi:hypothetical protein